MLKTLKYWLLIGSVALMLPFGLFGDVTGSILGVATDPSSAVMQGVRVSATNLDTNLVQEAITDATGQYRILALPVGRYKVEAIIGGFQKFVANGVILTVNEQRRVDVVLRMGATQQEVTVNAAAVQVETTNTQLGDVIDEKKVTGLPLNGRSYVDLLGLQPGVAPASSRKEGPGTVSVNGQRENNNGFLVNGADVASVGDFAAGVQPNLDAVQEFRLITNGFDAEYGRSSGAVMNTITKSGTNAVHGTAFDFLRNDKMDSRGFFDSDKGVLKRNQFGYAVGGPALKNKLFWFTDYQGTRQVNGGTAGETQVLSLAERQGNVGARNLTGDVTGSYWAQTLSTRLGYPVKDGEPYSAVFPGGVIPQRAFSAAAKGTLGFIPAPNRRENIFATAAASTRSVDDLAGQRVDFLNKRTGAWSAYYNFDDQNVLNPYGASRFPGFPSVSRGRNQQATLSNTHIFGPAAVNDFRVAYVRIASRSGAGSSDAPSLADMGFLTGSGTLGLNTGGPTGYKAIPQVCTNNFCFGSPDISNVIQNTYQISDNFSKIVGRHTFKFGADFRYYQLNRRDGGGLVGQFHFGGSETGYDAADYLIGAPDTFQQASAQYLDSRSKYGSAYAQDSIRLSPSLTMNFGVRWEFSQPWYDTQDKIVAMVPGLQSIQYPTAPKGLVYPGDPGIARTLAPTRYNNFAPRFGFAYSPSATEGILGKIFGGPGKTSIRAGAGLFYNAIQDQTLYWILGTVPFGEYWGSAAPPLFEQPFRTRSSGESQGQPFPYVIPAPGSAAAKNFDFSPYLPLASTLGYEIHNKLPYGMHYNFTIQRQLSGSMVLSLGFVGTLGRHLISMVENNPSDSGLCLGLRGSGVKAGTLQCGPFQEDETFTRPNGTKVNGTRPVFGPAFSYGYYEANWANSDYNSFQTSLQRNAGNSSFLLGYTWSKSMDNASFFNNRMNFANHALSRAVSNFDITHNFVASYTYTLPFDKMLSHLPKRLVRGWGIAGITRFATGLPGDLGGWSDNSLTGTRGLDYPNLDGPIHFLGDPRTNDHRWMSNDNFSRPALGYFGTSNPRPYHGPGFNNWNIGLHKDTQIRESAQLQIRAEFFNAFNHTQFNGPNGNIQSSRFGYIGSAKDPRIGQVAVKLIF